MKKNKPINQKNYEDITPNDLRFICSNESGAFTLFESKSTGRIYTIYRYKGPLGKEVVLEELTISN